MNYRQCGDGRGQYKDAKSSHNLSPTVHHNLHQIGLAINLHNAVNKTLPRGFTPP
jgi:hypothetical protein